MHSETDNKKTNKPKKLQNQHPWKPNTLSCSRIFQRHTLFRFTVFHGLSDAISRQSESLFRKGELRLGDKKIIHNAFQTAKTKVHDCKPPRHFLILPNGKYKTIPKDIVDVLNQYFAPPWFQLQSVAQFNYWIEITGLIYCVLRH